MDKLTAIKIKNPDGSYSTPIAISALAQNVLYGDGVYSVKDILDSLDARIDNITAVGTDAQLTAIRIGADYDQNDSSTHYASAAAAVRANDIKNRELVLVKDTQPTETWNKLWLDTSDTDEQRIISTDDMANIIATYYDEEADYAVGDYVIHEDVTTGIGKLYKCITAISGGEIWTAAHWDETNVIEDYNEIFQNVNDQIDDLKSAINEKLNYIVESFYVNGNHSSNADRIRFSVAAGEKYYIQTKSSTGEALAITPLAFDGNGNATNILPINATGTIFQKTATSNIVEFGFYISAPAAPCKLTVFIATEKSLLYNEKLYENQNVIEMLGGKSITFYVDGNHATTADQLNYVIPKGSRYRLCISVSTGETLTAAVVSYDSEDTATNIGVFYPFGTVIEKITDTDIVKFGMYIAAPSKPCYVTMTVIGESAGIYAAEQFDELDSLFGIKYTSWNITSGSTHSSNANKISIPIQVGDKVKALVRTSDGSTITGVLGGFGNISTNRIYEFTATSALDSVGVYMDSAPSSCKVTFYIMKDGYYIENEDTISTLWKDNIDSVLNDVALLQTYNDGCTFGFITDIHWETNWQKSPELIKYIVKNSSIDVWINGGDTATGDGGNGEQQLKWLYQAIGRYNSVCRFYSVIGNHDPNNNDGVGTHLSKATLRNILMPHHPEVTFGGDTYYWFDHQGTRFVCLDDGESFATGDSTQITWASNIISQSPLPVIVVMHIVFAFPSDTTPCTFYNNLISAIGNNSNVKLIMAGHLHNDSYFIDSTTGIPVILLDTDSRFNDDGITRNPNTLAEQCLSVVTADYTNRVIHVSRIGSIKNSFNVTY